MVLAEYKGHTDRVTCCALSKAGRYVASSSEDSTVRVSIHNVMYMGASSPLHQLNETLANNVHYYFLVSGHNDWLTWTMLLC